MGKIASVGLRERNGDGDAQENGKDFHGCLVDFRFIFIVLVQSSEVCRCLAY